MPGVFFRCSVPLDSPSPPVFPTSDSSYISSDNHAITADNLLQLQAEVHALQEQITQQQLAQNQLHQQQSDSASHNAEANRDSESLLSLPPDSPRDDELNDEVAEKNTIDSISIQTSPTTRSPAEMHERLADVQVDDQVLGVRNEIYSSSAAGDLMSSNVQQQQQLQSMGLTRSLPTSPEGVAANDGNDGDGKASSVFLNRLQSSLPPVKLHGQEFIQNRGLMPFEWSPLSRSEPSHSASEVLEEASTGSAKVLRLRAERDDARKQRDAMQREVDELRAEKEEIVLRAQEYIQSQSDDLSWQAQHYVDNIVRHRDALVAQLEHAFERLTNLEQQNATLRTNIKQRDESVGELKKELAAAAEEAAERVMTINKLSREARTASSRATRVAELLERSMRLMPAAAIAQMAFGDVRAPQVAAPFWTASSAHALGKAGMLLRRRVLLPSIAAADAPTSPGSGQPVVWSRCFVVVREGMLLRYKMSSVTTKNSAAQSSRTAVQPQVLRQVIHLVGGKLLSVEVLAPTLGISGASSRLALSAASATDSFGNGDEPPPDGLGSGPPGSQPPYLGTVIGNSYPFRITIRADAFAPGSAPKVEPSLPALRSSMTLLNDSTATAGTPSKSSAPITVGPASDQTKVDEQISVAADAKPLDDKQEPATLSLVFAAGSEAERQDWISALKSDIIWTASYTST